MDFFFSCQVADGIPRPGKGAAQRVAMEEDKILDATVSATTVKSLFKYFWPTWDPASLS